MELPNNNGVDWAWCIGTIVIVILYAYIIYALFYN